MLHYDFHHIKEIANMRHSLDFLPDTVRQAEGRMPYLSRHAAHWTVES